MRRLTATLLALPAVIALSAPARADICQNAPDFLAQMECLQTTYAQADAQLNAIWPRVMADHPSGGVREVHRKDIRAAQRAWIAFRDADCEARSKTGIPKYWESNRMFCLIEMTRARVATLQYHYLD